MSETGGAPVLSVERSHSVCVGKSQLANWCYQRHSTPVDNMDESPSPVWDQATGGADVRAQKSGSLLKWVNYVAGWQKRYFELQGGVLSYYRSAEEVSAGCRGSMLAREIDIRHKGKEMVLTAGNATFYLRASSEQELMRWITALELAKQQGGGPRGAREASSSRMSRGPKDSNDSMAEPNTGEPSWAGDLLKQYVTPALFCCAVFMTRIYKDTAICLSREC